MPETKKKRRAERTVNPEAMFLNYNPTPAVGAAPSAAAAPPVAVEPSVAAPPIVVAAQAEPEKVEPKPQEVQTEESSPLKNAGPIPAELLKDPYPVEIVPLVSEPVPAPVVQPTKFLTQERLIWISAVAVSWAVTAFAVLRALRII